MPTDALIATTVFEHFRALPAATVRIAWIAIAVALAGGLFGRWLPRGTGLGLTLLGVSAAALLIAPADSKPWVAGALALLVAGFAGICLRRERGSRNAGTMGPAEKAAVAGHAAALLAIWPLASLMLSDGATGPSWPLEFALATVLAVAAMWARADGDRPAGVAIALGLLIWIGLRASEAQNAADTAGGAAWLAFATAVASMACVLGDVLRNWLWRRETWLVAPERLVEAPRASAALATIAIMLATATAVAAALSPSHPVTPFSAFIAGLAACAVGHRLAERLGWASDLGLILVCSTWLFACIAWLPGWELNGVIGAAITSAFLLWLSWFWRQQLLDDLPWTTAGRLIPTARRLSQLGALATVAATAIAYVERVPAQAALPKIIVAAVFLLLLVRVHSREARASQSGAAALAAGAAGLALAAILTALMERFTSWGDPAIAVALVAVVLAAGLTRLVEESDYASACNAYLGALLPGVLLVRLGIDPDAAHKPAAWLGLAVVVLVATLRWARTRPRSALVAPA